MDFFFALKLLALMVPYSSHLCFCCFSCSFHCCSSHLLKLFINTLLCSQPSSRCFHWPSSKLVTAFASHVLNYDDSLSTKKVNYYDN